LCRRLFLEIVNQDSHPTRHFNHNPSKVGWKVNIMQENEYISPHLTVLEFYSEGLICGSNEIIDENDGVW
jgi:hypothetical protein